jgi:tRNA dimethylallyltransferase
MDIGTAKPSAAERNEVPHHGLDLVDPWDEWTVAQFRDAVIGATDDIGARGARPLLVGGTGLYLQAVIDDLDFPGRFPEVRASLEEEPDNEALHARLVTLDPVAAERMEPTNRRRIVRALEVTLGSGRPFSSYGPGMDAYPPCRFVLVGIRVPRDVLDDRIETRYRAQLQAGFLDEVRAVWDHPRGVSRTASQALGYKELAEHVEGRSSLDDALAEAVRRTRRFARRQERWFRRDPRIRWLDPPDPADPLTALDGLLATWDEADA